MGRKKKIEEKEKSMLETFLEDLQKISLVQKTVLLKKDFYTADDGKNSIINFNMDYLGDNEVPISDITELITLLKLSDLSSGDFEIDEHGISLLGNRKMFYKCADRNIIPHITKIENKDIEGVFSLDEESIKLNITEDEFNKTKSVLSKISDSIIILKRVEDEIKFIVIDKESPERFMLELFTFPIESDKIDDFDILFISKDSFSTMILSDYSCTISCIDDDFYKIIFNSNETNYSICSSEPVMQGFDTGDISKLVDKFLKKNSKKSKTKSKKKTKKKVVIEEPEEPEELEESSVEETKKETKKEKVESDVPKDLDDLDLNDDDFFDDDDFE